MESKMNTERWNTWKAHIDQKISSIPQGKSFVFYTDAHEGDVHEGGQGKGCYESLELVEYTSKAAAIPNVVYGGDVLGSEKTVDDAKKYLSLFLAKGNGLYDRFGSNAIFNIGNHDTNCVAWSYIKAKKEGFNPDYQLADILVRESYLYDHYIKPMEHSGYVSYDQIGIAAVKELLNSLNIEEFRSVFSFLGYDRHMALSDEALRQYIIRETEAMFQFHYTYTDHKRKIKYIVLDCGANGPMQYGIIQQDYTDIFHIHFYWLAHELLQTPEEYDIAVVSHMLGDNPEHGQPYRAKDFYKNLDQQVYNMSNVTAPIYRILLAYKGAKTAIMPDYTNVQEQNTMLKRIVNAIQAAYAEHDSNLQGGCADFRSVHNRGKLITLCGHWHLDRLFYVSEDMTVRDYAGEKITNQIPVIFTAACSVKRKSRELAMSGEAPHSACFDILTLTANQVVITRIGSGTDRIIQY